MTVRFTVLGSGSSGNASVLECDGFGLMIDCGLGPRVLANRLSLVGLSWKNISAVILTHTHGDHWHALTLAHLRRLNVPLIAHPRHHDALSGCAEHDPLRKAGLTRDYHDLIEMDISPRLTCLPVQVPHDADPTFAFRFDVKNDDPSTAVSIGYASDVGHAPAKLAEAFTGLHVLALEYNHDVQLQKSSGRHPILVNRVLGNDGHLSNDQAAEFTEQIARSSRTNGLLHLIQLHLSKDCNRPELAHQAARVALAKYAPTATITTATQFAPTKPILLSDATISPGRQTANSLLRPSVQPMLPGLEHDS